MKQLTKPPTKQPIRQAAPFQTIESETLSAAGINCQAVFDIESLPARLQNDLFEAHPEARQYRQLLMFGNGGKQFWSTFKEYRLEHRGELHHPIDQFSREVVQRFLSEQDAEFHYKFIYPGGPTINLQSLGQLVGWHHDSPLKIGINTHYGLWFAYRALVLANSRFPATTIEQFDASDSPCASCATRPCITSCPAKAMENQLFHLNRCLDYRVQKDSSCDLRCVAREACPVAVEHRYTEEQIRYHYGQSLAMLDSIAAKACAKT